MITSDSRSFLLCTLGVFLPITLFNGCAALSTPSPHVSGPVPSSLSMTLSPGATHKSTRIMFNSAIPSQTAVSGDQTESTPERDVPGDSVPQNSIARESAAAGTDAPIVPNYAAVFTDYTPSVSVGLGYRRDTLNWSVGGINGNPNILSELKWDELEIAELNTDFRWSNDSRVYLRGGFGIGWIQSGDNQDSDYWGNNRTMEFSRSNNDGGSGGVLYTTLGLGYRFSLSVGNEKIHIMPLVGYSYHVQDLEITKGVQTLSEYGNAVPLGPFSGLDSRFTAQWRGPWLGVDGELVLNKNHKLLGSFEYHWASYDAEADWNLREDFSHPKSYDQMADGEGIVASLGWRYQSPSSWYAQLGVRYQDWSTDIGRIRFYLSDGTKGTQPLNAVIWDSFSINLGVGYTF